MIQTTLCYLESNDRYLMLHRIKKKNDVNHDKWIGVGGKFEEGESPEDCVRREVLEETGLSLLDYRYRGIITFLSDQCPAEQMHLFTASKWEGTLLDCDEGTLEWVKKNKIPNLPIWEGDKLFFDLLNRNSPFFSLKLHYVGDNLTDSELHVY